MDVRRLHLLLELSRLGSMREVADTHGLTTSTVSQQIAALAREVGAPLVEPEGRRVRLTPAGRRLADHAVTILAAVDAARLDLDPDAEPEGTVRVGGFATAILTSLLPVVEELAQSHPEVEVVISEFEPLEAFALLEDDDLDLALTYDYNLAPAAPAATLELVPLWTSSWGLAVPESEATPGPGRPRTLGRPSLDRELPQHRRPRRSPDAGTAGRLRSADQPSHRQPRPGRGAHPRGPRRRAAPPRSRRPARRTRAPAGRPIRPDDGVRRDPARPRAVASAPPRARPTDGEWLNRDETVPPLLGRRRPRRLSPVRLPWPGARPPYGRGRSASPAPRR